MYSEHWDSPTEGHGFQDSGPFNTTQDPDTTEMSVYSLSLSD